MFPELLLIEQNPHTRTKQSRAVFPCKIKLQKGHSVHSIFPVIRKTGYTFSLFFFWEIVGLYRLMNRSLICVRHAAVFAHAFVECKPAARRFSAYAVGTSSRSRAYGSLIEGCKARSASEPSHVNHAST